jgi:membrane protein DedA with SNARE-associated domain/diacylglycerol kinase family enzyme
MRSDAAPLPTTHFSPTLVGAGALAAAATLAVITGQVPVPDFTGALEDASQTLGAWAYPAVAAFAFLETGAFVGLIVPGETAVVVGGVVAAEGDVELVPLIGLVWLAAAAGDLVSFLLGRRLGRPFLERHGPLVRVGPERLGQVERFYARHGGSAVLLGRFVGLVRAVSPFVAGASGLALRRFLPWSLVGTLVWAATFTLVGYGFSESFADSGDTAARIALGAALLAAAGYAAVTVLRARSGGAGQDTATDEPQRHEAAERAERRSDEPSGDHVEREVHAQINPRERHGGGDNEHGRPELGAHDGEGGCGGEGRGAVAGGERGIAGNRGQRTQSGIGHRRAGSREGLLQDMRDQRRGAGGGGRRGEGHGKAAAPQVGAKPQAYEQRSLDPPRGQHDEHGGEPRMLEGRSGFDERTVEVEQWSHRREETQSSSTARLIVVVNGRASGIEDPLRTADELVAVLEEIGAEAESAVTYSEQELWDVLRFAEASGWRVALVGGDGTLHAAANAPLARLPELALVPAGRANNIARALGIPTDRLQALAVAAEASAKPIDALRVATPDRFIYALEAVSAGFQAEARADYRADNSADLRQGLRALARALWRYQPYRASVQVDGEAIRSSSAAQLFFSNLPFFGFGFEVAPGADAADGRLDAILLEARGRTRLLRLLAAARRGRHIGRRGVLRMPATRVKLSEPLPLVADAVPLGNTTATVSVEPARLRLAFSGGTA